MMAALTLIILGAQGTAQNQQIKLDYVQFKSAENLLTSNPAEAERMLQPLISKYPDSYRMTWMYAISLGEQSKYRQSLYYLNKSIAIRPAMLQDPKFLLYYGLNLASLGEKQKAVPFLQKAIKINFDPAVSKASKQLLDQISEAK